MQRFQASTRQQKIDVRPSGYETFDTRSASPEPPRLSEISIGLDDLKSSRVGKQWTNRQAHEPPRSQLPWSSWRVTILAIAVMGRGTVAVPSPMPGRSTSSFP